MPHRPFLLEEKFNIVSLLENESKNIDVAKQYKTKPINDFDNLETSREVGKTEERLCE